MDAIRTEQIVRAIATLPPEKVAEVYDFVLFLQMRYGQSAVDTGDSWSEEDIRDLTMAAIAYAGQTVWADEDDGNAVG